MLHTYKMTNRDASGTNLAPDRGQVDKGQGGEGAGATIRCSGFHSGGHNLSMSDLSVICDKKN